MAKNTYCAENKEYDKSGKVTHYYLRNTETNRCYWVEKNEIKRKLKSGELNVLNLQLTSDNKLIEKNMKDSSMASEYDLKIKEALSRVGSRLISRNGNIKCSYKHDDNLNGSGFVTGGVLRAKLGDKQSIVYLDVDPSGCYYIYSGNNDLDEENLRSINQAMGIVYDYLSENLA